MSRSHAIVRACLAAAFAASMTISPAHALTTDTSGGDTTYRNHLPPAPEIHVISVYETMAQTGQVHSTGAGTVRVAYSGGAPMKPVTLVLSSYEPTVWTLQRDPGAVVEKIVLNGVYPQSIVGASGVPVVSLPGFSSYISYQWPHDTGGGDTQRLLVAVENLFETRISSYTGAYRASSFTVRGVPAGAAAENPRLGAGNLTNGPNSNLIYYAQTGEVKLQLTNLGYAPIPLPPSFRQRFFFSLANHDSSFNVAALDHSGLDSLVLFPQEPALNANRLGYSFLLLNNTQPHTVSLGRLMPPGIPDAARLREYLAAAHFSTDFQEGEFDLFVIAVPEPASEALLLAAMAGLRIRRRGRAPVR